MSFVSIKSKKNEAESKVEFDLDISPNDFRISDDAARRIHYLFDRESVRPKFLRVGIVGGGCSGLSYSFTLEQESKPADHIFRNGDVEICVDPKSMTLLGGSLLHWQESLKRNGFQVLNKTTKKSCSCGESFSR